MPDDTAPTSPGWHFGHQGPFGPHGPFGPENLGGRHGGNRPRGRARRGAVRLAILSLLTERAMNGYQMIQALNERSNGVWNPSPGSIYPALAQLTDEGLIEPIDESGQRTYRLTDAGEAEATKIGIKPWEAVADAASESVPIGSHALWHEYGQLALAARAALATGDPALVGEATAMIASVRRGLYGLLARGPETDDD